MFISQHGSISYKKHHLSCCASVQYKFGFFFVCLFFLSCCTAQFVGSLNPDQGLNPVHSSESFKSYPLDCQGIPRSYFLLISKSSVGLQELCSMQLKREPGFFLPIVSPFLIALSSSEFQMLETGNRLRRRQPCSYPPIIGLTQNQSLGLIYLES